MPTYSKLAVLWRDVIRRLRSAKPSPTLFDPCPRSAAPWATHSITLASNGRAQCDTCGASGRADDVLPRSTPRGLAGGRGTWVLASSKLGEPLWVGRVPPGQQLAGLTEVRVLIEVPVRIHASRLRVLPSRPSPARIVVVMGERDD